MISNTENSQVAVAVAGPFDAPNFHVERISSILDGIECKEVVDRQTVYKLIHSTLLLDEYSAHYKYVKLLHEDERNQIIKYLQRVDEGCGTAHIIYHRKKDGYGRSDPDGGVGGFLIRRALRAILFYGHMLDVDIVNAHPVFLSILCHLEGVSCVCLDQYIADRESILADTCQAYGVFRDDAKTLFIRLAYCGGLKSWVEDCKVSPSGCRPGIVVNGVITATPFVAAIKTELIRIAVYVWRKNQHMLPLIHARKAAKGVEKYNVYSSILSLVLQEHERRVLECVYKYSEDKGYIRNNEAVLAADGIQLRKDLVPDSVDIAGEFTTEVRDKLGFDLQFIVKPFDVSITQEDLNNNLLYCLHVDNAESDFSLAQFFVAKYGSRYVRRAGNDNMHYYTGVYWKELTNTDSCKDFLSVTFAADIKKAYSYYTKKVYDAAMSEKEKLRSQVKVQNGVDIGLSSGVFLIEDEVVVRGSDGIPQPLAPGASLTSLFLSNDEQLPSSISNEVPRPPVLPAQHAVSGGRVRRVLSQEEEGGGGTSDVSTDCDMSAGRGRGRPPSSSKGAALSPLDLALAEIDKKVAITISKLAKVFDIISKKLYDNRGRSGIMSIVVSLVTRDDFEFDQHPMLFAFNNKVFDLEERKFVQPRPDLYISQTCGWDYNDNYPLAHVEQMQAIIDSIFPNIDVKNFALSFYATGLIGKQVEAFVVLIGAGGNGKGLVSGMMLCMLGGYGYKLPATMLQGPLDMGANPQVANMHAKRFCITSEPDASRKICCGTVKELTGDTDLNTRGLYQSNTQIKLCLTLGFECNEVMELDDKSNGTVRRYYAILFEIVFKSLDKYNKLSEEEKRKHGVGNPKFKTTEWRETMRQALFTILVGAPLQAVLDAGHTLPSAPPICDALAQSHLARSDVFYQFMLSTYERKEGEGHVLSISQIFSSFKCHEMYRSLPPYEKRKFAPSAATLAESIQSHATLGADFLKRDRRFNGEKLKSDSLVNWCERVDGDEENPNFTGA